MLCEHGPDRAFLVLWFVFTLEENEQHSLSKAEQGCPGWLVPAVRTGQIQQEASADKAATLLSSMVARFWPRFPGPPTDTPLSLSFPCSFFLLPSSVLVLTPGVDGMGAARKHRVARGQALPHSPSGSELLGWPQHRVLMAVLLST